MRGKITLAVLLGLVVAVSAGVKMVDFAFSPQDFNFAAGEDGVVHLRVDDGMPFGNPGEPEIPVLARNVLLPPKNRAVGIRVISAQYRPLADDVELPPIQPPAVMPMPGIQTEPRTIPPNSEIYSRDEWFPTQPVKFAGAGNISGFSVAGILIYPVRYNPVRRQVEYLAELKVEVDFQPADPPMPARRSVHSDQIAREIVAGAVVNPQDTVEYHGVWSIDAGAKDYLIISPEELADCDSMRHLRLSLRRQGWNDTLITSEAIEGSYSGEDLPEKIRNCINDVWEREGISAVLLVGDTPYLGCRYAFAMDCEAGFFEDENDIPSDLYFSDLDGSWNADDNDTFGQVSDSVDLYPDLMVGRISVENLHEFNSWARKYFTYEENPPGGFGADAMFIGQVLWHDPYTPGGASKDMIRDEAFPDWFTFLRLYESLGTANLTSVTNGFNAGYSITNHDGHAAYMVIGAGGGDYFSISDADGLYNYPYCGVMYSIGCWPAAFDYDCIAEHFITNPDGGMVAFIGNSRYGWGSPGNPGYGYSDYFDRAFWKIVFSQTPVAGEAIAIMKARYAPYARWANVWRWKLFEINLLGETTARIWRNEPDEVSLELPEIIPSAGAGVGIDYPGRFWAVAIQDGEILDRVSGYGYAPLWIDPITSSPVEIAVFDPTGFHKLSIDTVLVGDGPYFCVDDISPNAVLPGSVDTIRIFLRNCGTEGCSPAITAECDLAAVDTVIYPEGTYSPGDTFSVAVVISVPADAENGDVIRGTLHCNCGGEDLPVRFGVEVAFPQLRVVGMYFEADRVGDALAPGETYIAHARIENTADVPFSGTVSFDCPDIGFSGSQEISLPPGTTSVNLGEMTVPTEAEIGVVPVEFDFSDAGTDTFWVSVGVGRFFDDAEGTPRFSAGGHWQTTSAEAHSPANSYVCVADDGFYPDNADDWLTSDTITIGEDARLTFWMKYFVTTYGSDGLHIWAINLDTRDSTHLDYVGSGGALPILFETGWTQWNYDIPYPPGSHIQIAFQFTSDGEDHDRGFFIDDIEVSWQATEVGTTAGIAEGSVVPGAIRIEAYPNPFNSTCKLVVPEGTQRVAVYDIRGNLVMEFPAAPRQREFLVDGNHLSSGIYYARVVSKEGVLFKKLLLVK